MATDVTASLANLQVMEVGVTGPGRARRLILVTGEMPTGLLASASNGQSMTRQMSVTARIGPELTSELFMRASANAAITEWQIFGNPMGARWSVDDVDADYDDESSHVVLKVDVSSLAEAPPTANAGVTLMKVSFSVQILAAE